MNFTNPRLKAVINDYPLGGNKRGQCTFEIEYKPGKGYRAVRTTTGKPKTDTYSGQAVIVDGDDGKTYILYKTMYGFIKIRRWDFMDANPGSIFLSDNPEQWEALTELINQCYTQTV